MYGTIYLLDISYNISLHKNVPKFYIYIDKMHKKKLWKVVECKEIVHVDQALQHALRISIMMETEWHGRDLAAYLVERHQYWLR